MLFVIAKLRVLRRKPAPPPDDPLGRKSRFSPLNQRIVSRTALDNFCRRDLLEISECSGNSEHFIQMTIFFRPRSYRRLTRSCWCRWCCKRAAMQDLFKLRDGPLDWYFCDSEHALDWLEHRHSSVEANRLLRMLPDERARALNGRTIEEVILKNPHA
jgi:hypothetical protein